MVARVTQFPSYKLWFPKKPSQKLYKKCHEPSRTLELILPKPLTELNVRSEKRGHLPRVTQYLSWFTARSPLPRFL